jgi:hypothetical protein
MAATAPTVALVVFVIIVPLLLFFPCSIQHAVQVLVPAGAEDGEMGLRDADIGDDLEGFKGFWQVA